MTKPLNDPTRPQPHWLVGKERKLLTEEQVKEARTPGTSSSEQARKWGVSLQSVLAVRYGKAYKWLDSKYPPLPKLTAEERVLAQRHAQCLNSIKRADKRLAKVAPLPEPAPVNVQEVPKTVQEARTMRARAEGGMAKLAELEHNARHGVRMSDDDWALLHRLRIGLVPGRYAKMRSNKYER